MKIICEFSNASSRTATPKATLQQKQAYYSLKDVNARNIVKNLASVTGRPISAHTSDVHSEMTLTIPSSASLTISNCTLIIVDYFIEVGTNDRLLL